MPTTLQPEILLATLKYDFKVMQRENSPNEVQKMVPQGYKFFWGINCSNGVLYPKMGYGWKPWVDAGNREYHPV